MIHIKIIAIARNKQTKYVFLLIITQSVHELGVIRMKCFAYEYFRISYSKIMQNMCPPGPLVSKFHICSRVGCGLSTHVTCWTHINAQWCSLSGPLHQCTEWRQ